MTDTYSREKEREGRKLIPWSTKCWWGCPRQRSPRTLGMGATLQSWQFLSKTKRCPHSPYDKVQSTGVYLKWLIFIRKLVHKHSWQLHSYPGVLWWVTSQLNCGPPNHGLAQQQKGTSYEHEQLLRQNQIQLKNADLRRLYIPHDFIYVTFMDDHRFGLGRRGGGGCDYRGQQEEPCGQQ